MKQTQQHKKVDLTQEKILELGFKGINNLINTGHHITLVGMAAAEQFRKTYTSHLLINNHKTTIMSKKVIKATNGDLHVKSGTTGAALKNNKVVKAAAKSKAGKKAAPKKAAGKKSASGKERKVLTVEEINLIVKELKKESPLSYAAIAEKFGLNSLTPIAHIKKHKMGVDSKKGTATSKDLKHS